MRYERSHGNRESQIKNGKMILKLRLILLTAYVLSLNLQHSMLLLNISFFVPKEAFRALAGSVAHRLYEALVESG